MALYEKNDQTKLVGQDITTTVGKEVDITEGIAEFTDANGNPGDTSHLTWGAGMFSGLWDRAGDYPVTIVYYDPATLQTKTVDITIHVTTNINITGKNDSTYVGVPKDIGDFVDTLIDTEGDKRTPGDDDVRLSWDSSKINWNKEGSYDVTITYEDLTTKETASTTVTVTVIENKEDISGQDITYKVGDTHPTLKDLVPDAHMADGTEVTDPSQFTSNLEEPDVVNWDTPGSYKVKIQYVDQLTGKTLETTVVVTVVAQDDEISIDAEGTQVKVGDKPTLKDLNARATDHNGNEVDINDIDSDIDKIDWNKPGEHDVILTYTDNGETVTKVVTVTVVSDQALSVQDSVDTWEGQPLNPQDVVTVLTDSHGDVDNDLTNAWWKFDDKNWDKPGTYTVTVYYTDKYGNTVSKDVTIVVNEDKTSIDGTNYETTTGNTPTLSDVNASATDANGDPVGSIRNQSYR
ncbi:hypothetical protein [Pediococcus acidilactici]|uniref:hypothetical protein n=1 Tax=Pediococcus acidilactici TaxID=1254 RepID=UPI001F276DE6|nr:hypothetical protein [Pediococcus acidilactici]MCQ9153352.1 hypothetical protein [Pediococcus acidilactici]MCQ9161735.1 hypothetical protein [Pediococcus acidilactici]